ncbi:fructosamine kinase family protein [Vibrio sp. WJH972]
MWQVISKQISSVIDQDFFPHHKLELDGGDINQSFRISDDSLHFFVKTNEKECLPMLVAEADGLEALAKAQALTVPNVIALGTTKSNSYLVLEFLPMTPIESATSYALGVDLARQHQWGEQGEYGFDLDNYIGYSIQPNGWHKKWSRFFAEQRIGWQLQLLREKGIELVDIDQFVDLIAMKLAHHHPKPSLLHGDLWSGNIGRIGRGAVAFDPACYWGDRECDIAMTELFNRFDEEFYRGYNDIYPLDVHYPMRRDIYNLYHILNHCNCFAGHYIGEAQNRINRIMKL